MVKKRNKNQRGNRMDRPRKENPKKQSKMKQLANQKEIEQLAKCIVQALKSKFEEVEEPFECYAYQLRMRWHQDLKVFCDRFNRGYEVLLEQLRSYKTTN